MVIDWDVLQKDLSPVRSFDVLGANLGASFSYGFVQQYFNASISEMLEYTGRILGGDSRQRYSGYLEALTGAFERLAASEIQNVRQLVEIAQTRAAFAAFCENRGIDPQVPVSVLKFLTYWFVPVQKYLRELARPEDGIDAAIARLRPCGIRFNLDLLEQGRTPAGRKVLAERSGLAEAQVRELVNRADFSRLPWASKATISNYIGAGYGSLARLAAADPEQLSGDFYNFGQSIGKNLKHGNEIDNGQRIARIVPRIVVEDESDDSVR